VKLWSDKLMQVSLGKSVSGNQELERPEGDIRIALK
jgi:hypothetical protein